MSLERPVVFVTEHDDGSADFTISFADDDHKFSVSPKGDTTAKLSYEETLSWKGQIRTSTPDNEVWKMLMQSEKMTDYLESQNLTGVERERN